MQSALASDIAWGRLLNDLGRVIPEPSLVGFVLGPSRAQGPYPASLGTVTFNGTAFDFPDAASWLRTLDSDRWPAINTGWVLSTTSGERSSTG